MKTTNTNTLKELYNNHSGYASDKWDIYLSEYQRLFSPRRVLPVKLLEIGIQNGGSLEIWNRFFHNAKLIVGCDINPDCSKLSFPGDVIKLIVGDINHANTLSEILNYSNQFDIIIDDGSHTSTDIIESFCNLFPHVSEGGQYIIEDLHCSYWKRFQGGLFYPKSSMAFFRALTDILNFEHWGIELSRQEVLKPFETANKLSDEVLSEIHSIEFINSMCVVTKMHSDNNLLGIRHISGERELVSPVRHVDGTFSIAQPQSNTKSSSLANNIENERLKTQTALQEKDRLITDLNEKIALLEEKYLQLQALTAQNNSDK